VVVANPLRRLEQGVVLKRPTHGDMNVCGSLYMMLGDHPGQAKASGLRGPLAQAPSRFSEAKKDDLDKIGGVLPPHRDSLATKKFLEEGATLLTTHGQVVSKNKNKNKGTKRTK
jgi:hypothetical protein